MESIDLELSLPGPSPCRVVVGEGLTDRLVSDLRGEFPDHAVAVVSDSNVAPLHGQRVCSRLAEAGARASLLVFEAGEGSKTRASKARLEDAFLESGFGRRSAVVAVGGGVTGDLAGFVAATWHRGVPVIQVPTTLLSMVDASLGGKTGVNLPGAKNIVGAFHDPWGVYADVATLATLPEEELVLGCAEVVKSAVVADAELFAWLESNAEKVRAADRDALVRVVAWCIAIKARVVAEDPREAGRRAVLNFGHTVAHAIEAAAGYRVRHGHAVAIGLRVEGKLAVRYAGLPAADLDRIDALLRAFGLDTSIPPTVLEGDVLDASRRDKKSRAGEIRCALPVAIGAMAPGDEVTIPVEERDLRIAMAEARDGFVDRRGSAS